MKHLSLIKTSITLLIILVTGWAMAQTSATSANDRANSYKKRGEVANQSVAAGLEMINIGPTIMSGRVTDLAVNDENPHHYYVAYASGGLWVTENAGASFKPLFDYEAVMTIGDIAVDWKNNIIWLGSGESNSSRSSYSGNGMYKSTDGGKTWEHLGLDDTHHIGRVILHPNNPDIVWVAALGHLYSPNPERGVYKTTDGGKTWEKVLFVSNDAGAVDLVIDPTNPDILYAGMWERERKAWNFKGSGKGSGIYKSTDGGKNWKLITTADNGFPADEGVGRIGLAISYQNPFKIYALLDNQNRRDPEKDEYVVTKNILRSMSKADFLNLKDKDINEFLDRNYFPRKYNAVDIKNDVKADKVKPNDLVSYLEDANSMLFDTPVKGAEVYVSENGGDTWAKTHEDYIDGLYSSYGYYFGVIKVAPYDENKLYILGVPILRSDDGGKNWESIGGDNQHGDHQALWVSANTKGLMINGNDGGVNTTYDDGETWTKQNSPSVGQFYAVNVDYAKNYNVYGGLQDNGVWTGPANYRHGTSWHGRGQYPYKGIYGGDGMQVVIDRRDNNTVYTGLQFGNYARINKATGETKSIKPSHELGENPLRFNWQSPIHLSIHNQDVVYFGSNKFHRSLNQAKDWDLTSEDLTLGGKKGNVPYGTLTTIDESPLQFGLIYVGSDDGLVHVTRDGGVTWKNISAGLEKEQWVSRVEASNFDKDRVYVALNGYRWDRFDAMVYVSNDGGATWEKIGADLPKEPVNVIREDPVNENLIYVGTDHGLYVSLDRGKTFNIMDKKLPHVPVHDLVIQEAANDLVIGTHGRSIYKANVEELQQLDARLMAKNIHMFGVDDPTYNKGWGGVRWSRWYGFFEPEMQVPLYVKNGGIAKLNVYSKKGTLLYSADRNLETGINYLTYDYTIDADKLAGFNKELKKAKVDTKDGLKKKENDKFYLIEGGYKLEVSIDGQSASTNFKVKEPRKRPERKPQKRVP
ncbi:MAG: glycosyl hydrolase [Bacteroidota bacterium]